MSGAISISGGTGNGGTRLAALSLPGGMAVSEKDKPGMRWRASGFVTQLKEVVVWLNM